MFGTAILAAAIRTYIRVIKLKQFAIEDGLLLFAVAILGGVTVVYYLALNNMYELIDPILLGMGDQLLVDILKNISTESKESNAGAILSWLVLFPIKFAYLFFFRKLVTRLGKIQKWLWCVMACMVCAESVYHHVSNEQEISRTPFSVSKEGTNLKFLGPCRNSLLCCHSICLSLYQRAGNDWYGALISFANTYASILITIPFRTLFRTIGKYQKCQSSCCHYSF